MIDLHVHILPGLDDGPSTMAEALTLARACVADGVHMVVATPHMCDGFHRVTREDVLDGVRRLQACLDAAGIPLQVRPGADVHIEPDLCDRLRDGRVVTVCDAGRYVLRELPHDLLPPHLAEFLFSVQVAGVTPIITHPERNLEVQGNPSVLRPLVEGGSLVQLTAASLLGHMGRRAARCARQLLVEDLAHVVASDAHGVRAAPSPTAGARRLCKRPPAMTPARAAAEDLVSLKQAFDLFVRRPEQIVAGQYVDQPDPARVARRTA